jgi:hypothetical protein
MIDIENLIAQAVEKVVREAIIGKAGELPAAIAPFPANEGERTLLVTPPRRRRRRTKRRSSIRRPWTDEEKKEARGYHVQGLSCSEIAHKLRRPPSSVNTLFMRDGVKPNKKPRQLRKRRHASGHRRRQNLPRHSARCEVCGDLTNHYANGSCVVCTKQRSAARVERLRKESTAHP